MKNKKRKIPWNDFGKLDTKDALDTYLDGYEYHHKKFCHYTNCTAINNILGSKSFYISNVSAFNDICDREQFGQEIEQRYFYSLCFSTGVNENLALWYLYAGMAGDGGRIVFTPAQMEKLIETSKYYIAFLIKTTITE